MVDPDALRYLRFAEADLVEAQRMVELTGFRDSSIGFRLQQACEKALKSWIHSKGGLAPFTHDSATCLAAQPRQLVAADQGVAAPLAPVIRLLVGS